MFQRTKKKKKWGDNYRGGDLGKLEELSKETNFSKEKKVMKQWYGYSEKYNLAP